MDGFAAVVRENFPPSLAVPAFVLLLIFTIHTLLSRRSKLSKLPLPPGPKGPPILGVTAEMLDPQVKAWRKFEKWTQDVGAKHLLRVETLGQTHMIVNTAVAAKFLLEKRGGIYADRPRNAFYTEMVEKNMVLANIHGDHDAVKRRRALLHDLFSKIAVEQWQDVQLDESRNMLAFLLREPSNHRGAIKTSQRATIIRNVYSDALTIPSSTVWATVDKAHKRFRPPIEQFMRIYPVLRLWPSWLPGGDFRKIAREYHEEDRERWMRFRGDLCEQMKKGKVPPCFLSRMYEENARDKYGFSDLELAWAAGNLLTAGGDLPDITLRIFVIAMLHFPRIYSRLQHELDVAVGPHRLPDFSDKNHLPYLRATILEVQRWRPLQPIGVAHRCTEENEWEGMRIPEGTIMHPNLWAMSMDPAVYENPAEFRPERFLSADGTSLSRKNEPPAFGFGRRMCSAANLAENNLFINVASLAWAFDLVPPTDEKWDVRLPDADAARWMDRWDGVLALDPPPCEVTMRVRSPEREAIIRTERQAAKVVSA